MQNLAATYLPFLTSFFSACTALIVAFIAFKSSRSVEGGRVRASYLTYAIQKIMDEYVRYDPVVDLSEAKENFDYVRLIERRFDDCRGSIRRISPLIPRSDLKTLEDIENRYSKIIIDQHNSKISKKNIPCVSADEYTQMLSDYINAGLNVLRNRIELLRLQLEAGEL